MLIVFWCHDNAARLRGIKSSTQSGRAAKRGATEAILDVNSLDALSAGTRLQVLFRASGTRHRVARGVPKYQNREENSREGMLAAQDVTSAHVQRPFNEPADTPRTARKVVHVGLSAVTSL